MVRSSSSPLCINMDLIYWSNRSYLSRRINSPIYAQNFITIKEFHFSFTMEIYSPFLPHFSDLSVLEQLCLLSFSMSSEDHFSFRLSYLWLPIPIFRFFRNSRHALIWSALFFPVSWPLIPSDRLMILPPLLVPALTWLLFVLCYGDNRDCNCVISR